jgi:hypothetical protein
MPHKPHLPTTGPNAGDCLRLWRTLTTEYIPELRLELEPVEIDHKNIAIALRITSISSHPEDKTEVVNMWAMKCYQNELYLISMAQLFDLLIVAYRAIDGFFTLGEALRPPQVKR